MSRPLSPVEVESEIWRLSERAEQVVSDLAERARAAAEAEVAYKVARAKALLVAAQEAGRATRSQLDALRSINANLRSVT
jgi:predicted AAA+ superfamily ATPase